MQASAPPNLHVRPLGEKSAKMLFSQPDGEQEKAGREMVRLKMRVAGLATLRQQLVNI